MQLSVARLPMSHHAQANIKKCTVVVNANLSLIAFNHVLLTNVQHLILMIQKKVKGAMGAVWVTVMSILGAPAVKNVKENSDNYHKLGWLNTGQAAIRYH